MCFWENLERNYKEKIFFVIFFYILLFRILIFMWWIFCKLLNYRPQPRKSQEENAHAVAQLKSACHPKSWLCHNHLFALVDDTMGDNRTWNTQQPLLSLIMPKNTQVCLLPLQGKKMQRRKKANLEPVLWVYVLKTWFGLYHCALLLLLHN